MSINKSKVNILVVDDDHDLVKFLEIEFSKSHYNVEHAYSIKSAMPLIDSIHFDWIILDVIFKNEGVSFDIVNHTKFDKDCMNYHTPFVVMSAHMKDSFSENIKAKNENIICTLKKPFAPKELTDTFLYFESIFEDESVIQELVDSSETIKKIHESHYHDIERIKGILENQYNFMVGKTEGTILENEVNRVAGNKEESADEAYKLNGDQEQLKEEKNLVAGTKEESGSGIHKVKGVKEEYGKEAHKINGDQEQLKEEINLVAGTKEEFGSGIHKVKGVKEEYGQEAHKLNGDQKQLKEEINLVAGTKEEFGSEIHKVKGVKEEYGQEAHKLNGDQEQLKEDINRISGPREHFGSESKKVEGELEQYGSKVHKINPYRDELNEEIKRISGSNGFLGKDTQRISGDEVSKKERPKRQVFSGDNDFSDFESMVVSSDEQPDEDDMMKVKRLEIVDSETGGKGPMTLGGKGSYGSKIKFGNKGVVRDPLKKSKEN